MSSNCNPEPCILWGVSAVWFGIGCFLLVLALIARYVVILLLAIINLILKRWDRGSWCDPLASSLLVPTTWFLRFGCLFGFYDLVTPQPYNQRPVTLAFFFVFAIPFFFAWCIWTHIFLQVVARIVVDEFEFAELQQAQQKANKRKYTQVDTDAIPSSGVQLLEFSSSSLKESKPKRLRSPRATSLHQVLLIFRVLILIMVILICTSILGFDFADLLNKTAIWWFVIVLALIPHLRSIYLGTLFLFLYRDDEWNSTHLQNAATLNWMEFVTGDPSLARVKLDSVSDGSLWVVPHTYFIDQFGRSETRNQIIEVPLLLAIGVKEDITSSRLRDCINEVKEFLTTVHPALSLHNARTTRSGFVTFDADRSEILVMCGMFVNWDSAPALRSEILSTLLEVIRPVFRETSEFECNRFADAYTSLRFVKCVPESRFPKQANLYLYSMLDPSGLNSTGTIYSVDDNENEWKG